MISVGDVISAVNKIVDQVDQMSANNHQGQLLKERITMLKEVVQSIENIDRNDAFKSPLQKLTEVLSNASEVLDKFTKKNWFFHFGQAKDWQKNLKNINDELSNIVQTFQTSLQVQGLANQKNFSALLTNLSDSQLDAQALAKDITEVSRKLSEMLQDKYHTQADIEAIATAMDVVKEMISELSMDHRAMFSKMDELNTAILELKDLAKTAPTHEVEIVVAAAGSKIRKLQHTDADIAFEFEGEIPDSKELERLRSFSSDLSADLAQSGGKRRKKITVVEKGAEVEELFQKTANLLISKISSLTQPRLPSQSVMGAAASKYAEPSAIVQGQEGGQKKIRTSTLV